MKSVDKKRILTSAVMVGIICILMVVFTAYSAELRCENNKLMGENEALQSEIETLNVKIKSANKMPKKITYFRTKTKSIFFTTNLLLIIPLTILFSFLNLFYLGE